MPSREEKERENERGRAPYFIGNFNIYRLYPPTANISICIYPPFPSLATAAAVGGGASLRVHVEA